MARFRDGPVTRGALTPVAAARHEPLFHLYRAQWRPEVGEDAPLSWILNCLVVQHDWRLTLLAALHIA